jgi:hypothetical protein
MQVVLDVQRQAADQQLLVAVRLVKQCILSAAGWARCRMPGSYKGRHADSSCLICHMTAAMALLHSLCASMPMRVFAALPTVHPFGVLVFLRSDSGRAVLER